MALDAIFITGVVATGGVEVFRLAAWREVRVGFI